MKTIILHNPSDKNITSYPIEEAQYDQDGNVVYDNDGNYNKTDRTLEWSIQAGEQVEFPDYVANYLKKIYDFLEVVDATVKQNDPVEEVVEADTAVNVAKPKTGNINCKFCGKGFKNGNALGLHIAHNHLKEII